MLLKLSSITATALFTLLFVGCGGSSSSEKLTGNNIILDPKNKILPFPSNLLFLPSSGGEEYGTLNIPYDPNEPAVATIIKAMNKLDGFSTTSPIVIPTNTTIDPQTLYGRVHIYQAEFKFKEWLPFPTQVIGEFKDFTFLTKDNSIVLIPTAPLEGNSDYIVVIDKGVRNLEGELVTPNELAYLLFTDDVASVVKKGGVGDILDDIESLNDLREYYHQLLDVVGRKGTQVATIFSFKTQTIGAVAKNFIEQDYNGSTLTFQDIHLTSKELLEMAGFDTTNLKGNAQIYTGTLKDVPYYLGVPSPTNYIAPLTQEFEVENFKPKLTAKLDIPVLLSFPKECKKERYPVAIFQHGITQNRTNLLAIAETLANSCYVGVAIDLPLHGITDEDSPFFASYKERTFNLDLLTQDEECNIISLLPDGKIDCSGTHYINLQNPAISRDNIRQSFSDLVALRNALKKNELFDTSKIAYIGHSLGSIVPFGHMAFKPFKSAVLANPGGGIVQLLFNSPTFGPILKGVLAEYGLEENSTKFEQYTLLSQTLIDDADPINYAKKIAPQPTLVFEVKGDEVIPNSVPNYPLSGTEPLLKFMEAKNILDLTQEEGLIELKSPIVYSKFQYGTHSTFLLPDYPEVTNEMHIQTGSFISNEGKKVFVKEIYLLDHGQ